MFRYSKLSGKKVLAMLITFTVIGIAFMIIISLKCQETEKKEARLYNAPAAGMSSVIKGYIASAGKSSVNMLSTTAVAAGTGSRYYNEDGSNVGKLIVCTADEFAPVYLIKDNTSGMYGKIYKDAVATLISDDEEEGWCKVVSGNVSGYVQTENFAFGEAAEALDYHTYVKMASILSDELTLREEEDLTSVAKCILSPENTYEVVREDKGNGWTKLNVNGVGEGFVLTEYITVDSVQKVGITVDQEYIEQSVIGYGIEEAEAREAMWTANRIAAEAAAEAERLATEEAYAAAEAAAAEAARIQAEYEAQYTTVYSADEETDAAAEDTTDYVSEDTSVDDEDWSDADTEYNETEYVDDSQDYSIEDDYTEEDWSDNSNDYEEEDWSDDSDDYTEDYAADYSEDTYTEDSYEDYVDTSADIRQQLVSYARSFCGWLPYVSGGHSLSSGADCSGFTSAIYAAFGYYITPSSVGQQYEGRSVSVSEALPGDIIIYNYGQHVAIYSGGGMKIHSPYPGEVVSEGSMYSLNITDIRRIIE